MRYRLKLTITILLLVAVSFGIGGTLMIATSFYTNLEKEKQSALTAFETTQNTLYLLNALGDQGDLESLADILGEMDRQGFAQWQALRVKAGDEVLFHSGDEALLAYDLPIPGENQCCSQTG